MPRFRFRAQAALDLRHRQLEDAQRELVRAERDRDIAKNRLDDAQAALAAGRDALTEKTRTVSTVTELQWYRFWILRLEHERRTHARVLDVREATVITAASACLRARQRCESLQRFRDRAWSAYEAAEAAEERKLLDELATRRFVAQRNGNEAPV